MKHHTFPNYPFFFFFLKFPLCPTSLAHHGFADFFTYKFFVLVSRSVAFLISFSFLARYLSLVQESLLYVMWRFLWHFYEVYVFSSSFFV